MLSLSVLGWGEAGVMGGCDLGCLCGMVGCIGGGWVDVWLDVVCGGGVGGQFS